MMRIVVALLLLLLACRDAYVLPAAPDGNAMPLAQAGAGSTVLTGTLVRLDGSGSFDPDGEIASYEWLLVASPSGSYAQLSSLASSTAMFVADLAGTYVIRLTVRDRDGGAAQDEVTFIAERPPPTIVTALVESDDTTFEWLETIRLTGAVSATNGFEPTYEWSITERPLWSTSLLKDSTTLTPSFVPDVQGTYTFQLIARADGMSGIDSITVTVETPGVSIGAPSSEEPISVAYSAALDRFVVLRGWQVRSLALLDPATGLGPSVTLPAGLESSRAVVLDPSGMRAAIATRTNVTIVDLQTMSVEGSFAVASNYLRLLFASDDRVHLIPEEDDATIVTLDLATGTTSELRRTGGSRAPRCTRTARPCTSSTRFSHLRSHDTILRARRSRWCASRHRPWRG